MSDPTKQQQYMQQPQSMQHVQYSQPPQVIPQSSVGQQQQFNGAQVQIGQQHSFVQAIPMIQQQQVMSQPYGIQQPYGIPQPHIAQTPQVTYQQQRHSCCGSYPRTLSDKMHTVNFKLGICMVVLGIATLGFGIAGFFAAKFTSYHSHYTITYYNMLAFIAPNVWAAIFYIVNGALAVAAIRNKTNDHLMNAFYAFSIMSLILSVAHFSISLGTIFSYGASQTVWFNIVSIVFSVTAFSFALAFIIILGREIYCKKSNPNMIPMQYQDSSQIVLPQSLMQSELANYPPGYNQSSQSAQLGQNPAEANRMSGLPSQKPNQQLPQYTS